MKAFLVLQDGTVFEGVHIGANREVVSEIVFSTSMGYVETLTDPSYAGTAVCMTYPLIGNYGVCRDDGQSPNQTPDAVIVRELSRIPSNFRSEMSIQEFLKEKDIPGIAGIDTRALTRILREKGAMNGMITMDAHYDKEEILRRLQEYVPGKRAQEVCCPKAYTLPPVTELSQNGPLAGSAHFDKEAYEKGVRETKPTRIRELNGKGLKVAVLDLGMKKSLAEAFVKRGCQVTVYPADTGAEELINGVFDGIVVSNGPANPGTCKEIVAELKKICDTELPLFGTGLGHSLIALAAGADARKMKNGHRGCNYPVKDLVTGKTIISSQNHGYVVETQGLSPSVAEPSFVNVNDGTNEGLNFIGKRIFTVAFDMTNFEYLFDRFISMMKGEM